MHFDVHEKMNRNVRKSHFVWLGLQAQPPVKMRQAKNLEKGVGVQELCAQWSAPIDVPPTNQVSAAGDKRHNSHAENGSHSFRCEKRLPATTRTNQTTIYGQNTHSTTNRRRLDGDEESPHKSAILTKKND